MNHPTFWCALALSSSTAGALAASPTTTELDRRLRDIDRGHRSLVEISELAKSGQGRPIHLIRLGAEDRAGRSGPDTRPALLIVAGASGDHLVGTDVALGLAESLVADHADLLQTTTVYLVPRLNPDAAEQHLQNDGRGAVSRSAGRTLTPDDADRDGRTDEDGPNDLNGDGVITMMRVKNPPSWLKADLVIDTNEPRLMRAPNHADGEVAQYALLPESRDDDGDGRFAEDGPGGVELDMNFPHLWPEHENGAGAYPLSEPSSRALVRWMLDRPNIAGVLVFGPHDTIVKIPESGKMDATGEAPVGIEAADKAIYEKISEVFKEITKIKSSPTAKLDGSFVAWAYAQFGAPSFSTPVWVRPDNLETEKKDGENGKNDAAPSGRAQAESAPGGMTTAEIQALVAEFQSADDAQRQALGQRFRSLSPEVRHRVFAIMQGGPDPGAGGAATGKKSKADEEDVKWLTHSDEARGGAGFIDWQPFKHPQLGDVEIGGFRPGFKIKPPDAELDRLIAEQTRFAADLLGRLPRIRLDAPRIERTGPGVWRIELDAINDGYFPSRLAIAKKVGRLSGVIMMIDTPREDILAGEKTQIADGIVGSGGRITGMWLIAADSGETVTVIVRSPELGERRIPITLPN